MTAQAAALPALYTADRSTGVLDRQTACVLQEAGMISVYNDGPGIPVEKHKVEGVWLPEMIFGQLLTGSNYDDSEEKVRQC